MNIDCLIPAAGLSSRMGKWKMTLPYKGGTIIEKSISNALKICNKIILVTGYRGEELNTLVETNSKILTVKNENFKKGMFSSIQTGVHLIESEWFFITMGDMPNIGIDIFKTLINTRDTSPGEFDIVRPLYQGKRGHPVLLHKKTIQTILKEPVSSEMKKVFTHFKVLDIDMNLPDTFRDIDTPEEYRFILNDTEL